VRHGFIASSIALAALLSACSPPGGERGTAVETEVAEVERFPVPPKRSEPMASAHYPKPLQGDRKP